jgi:tetratricopeptide (TPR) repeat protein
VEATTLSGQLSRFKRDGLVEEVDTSGTRAGYQLAERFLNIWYLMRHGTRKTKQRLRWFTIFLTKLFNVDELERMAGEAQLGKAHWKAEHCEAVIDAYNLKKLSLGGKNLPDKESNVLSALFEKAKRQIESHNVTEAIVMLDDLLDQMADAGATVAIAMVLSAKGSLLRAEKCYDEAIQIFDEVIRRFADSNEPQLLEVVAEAFTQKGQALAQLGRFSDANLTFDLTIKKFENSDDTKIQQSTARAMVGKAFALGDLDRLDEAIETFELVDARFGQNTDQGTMDAVATALAVKGIDLLQLGRHDEAIGIFDIIESRFDKNVSDDISWTVANALVVKGITYAMLGQSDIAIKTFESVIQRFYSSIDGMLSKPVLRAYANMADLLSELGRFEESNSVYNEMNARFGDQEWNELDISLSSAIAKMFVHSFWIVGRREVSVRKLQTIAQNNHDQAIFKTSLFWMFMAMENRDEADRLASELEALTGGAKALFQAGIDLSADNIGASLLHLAEALQLGLEGEFDFSEDLLWYLRIAVERGYGEKLINWFDESGNADRYAPVYGALVAHIKGEGHLLDLNPEVRSVAKPLFAKLSAGKQTSAKGTKKRERQ